MPMTLASLNRWKASAFHLLISAAIAALVMTVMLTTWYPRPYFEAMGGRLLVILLVGVDVVIGPLITLVVFDPRKKSLKVDLAIIAALQLAALVYGCYVMFSARPVYNVFVVDRFETVSANQVDDASRAKAPDPKFRTLPLDGPRIVAAREPDDPGRRAEVVLSATMGGPDLANLPEFYVPYDQLRAGAALAARPLAALARRHPDNAVAILDFVAEAQRPEIGMGYVPMKARNRDMSVVVDRQTGEVVGILPIYPW